MMHSPGFLQSRRRALLALTASALAPAAYAASSRNESPNTMPNGTWTVVSKRSDRPGTPDVDYLPPGTRIRLLFQGPTAYAEKKGSSPICGDDVGAAMGHTC